MIIIAQKASFFYKIYELVFYLDFEKIEGCRKISVGCLGGLPNFGLTPYIGPLWGGPPPIPQQIFHLNDFNFSLFFEALKLLSLGKKLRQKAKIVRYLKVSVRWCTCSYAPRFYPH